MFEIYLNTLILLTITGFQGFFHFTILGLNHPSFALLTSAVYLFTETLVIFFFVGTGSSIKDYVNENNVNPEYNQRAKTIKRILFPQMLVNIVMIMTLFITGGGVDTKRIPEWIHGILFVIALIHFIRIILIQHRCFKRNTELILEML